MVVGRAARVVAPAVIAAALLTAMATSARAGTTISPPTITAPLGGLGPYPVGAPVTFTFSEQGAGTAVAYKYTVNGVTEKVPAPAGVASVQIVPVRQTSFLTAYAVAADGTVSAGTEDIFKAFTAQPAADKDLNGDGPRICSPSAGHLAWRRACGWPPGRPTILVLLRRAGSTFRQQISVSTAGPAFLGAHPTSMVRMRSPAGSPATDSRTS